MKHVIEREWTIRIRREPGDRWQDVRRRFTKQTVIRPDTLAITVRQKPGRDAVAASVLVSGRRLLKNGEPGNTRSSESWSDWDISDGIVPGWIADVIKFATDLVPCCPGGKS